MGRYLRSLQKRGISARIVGGELKFKPRAAISEHLWAQIEAHMADILAELRGEDIEEQTSKAPAPAEDTTLNAALAMSGGVLAESADCPFDAICDAEDRIREETGDPRPDIAEDHEQWTKLLREAHGSEIYHHLHFLRCMGAKIHTSLTGGWITSDNHPGQECIKSLMGPGDIVSRGKSELIRLLGRVR